jgi:hypothetical protein
MSLKSVMSSHSPRGRVGGLLAGLMRTRGFCAALPWVIATSSSPAEPSSEISERPVMVSRWSLNVPVDRREKWDLSREHRDSFPSTISMIAIASAISGWS